MLDSFYSYIRQDNLIRESNRLIHKLQHYWLLHLIVIFHFYSNKFYEIKVRAQDLKFEFLSEILNLIMGCKISIK